MHFAIPQDTLPLDRSTDRPQPSAATQRVGATVMLLGMALCAVVLKTHAVAPAPESHQAAQNSDVATPAKIIAPEFCKDQTWPYIDSRCLRRVDNPAPPATPPRIVTPPANTAAAAPAPNNATVDTISASAAGSAAAPNATVNRDDSATPPAAPAPAASSPSNPADPRMQVMDSVFPAATPGAASESGAQRSDVASYQHTGDGSQHRRSWNRRSNFFGFHF